MLAHRSSGAGTESGTDVFPSGRPKRTPLPFFFQPLGSVHIPGLHFSFSIFNAASEISSLSLASPCCSLSFLSLHDVTDSIRVICLW